MVTAALEGYLDNVKFNAHPIFKVLVPESVPNVPPEILDPRNTWADPVAYDRQAQKLAELFVKNFTRFEKAHPEIISAGPDPKGVAVLV
jgi:phosphoenolpyruvate carboxykinase (ATP)